MSVSSPTAYWTRTHVVMGWNPGQVNCLHAATMLLLYILQSREFFENLLPHIVV
jgi:hypothetical protein